MSGPSRTLRIRPIVGSLAFLILSCLLPALVLPVLAGRAMRSRGDRIENALLDARSVRLEAFLGGKVLATRTLDEKGRAEAVEAIHGDLSGGAPFTLAMCFVPHHRVIAVDSNGVEFDFTICFECDEARISGTNPFAMPTRWKATLRRLFERHGMLTTVPE